MVSVAEARERILEKIGVLDPIEMSVTEAHGCVLAESVRSPEDVPGYAGAAIDGYAIRSEDTKAAASNPVSLTILGEARPGKPFAGRLAFGEAVRVVTGTALPAGADAVVDPQEVAVVGSSMAVGRAVPGGDGVRPAGDDVARGEIVMQEGQRLRGMDVGVLAALGRSRALIRPRPRTVLLAVGEGLKEPGEQLGPGMVRDSVSFTLAGMTREAGAEPVRAGITGEDTETLREKLQGYQAQADVFLVACSGTSEDVCENVRQAAAKLGEVETWDVDVEPGHTLIFGAIEGRPFFGLPGDSVGSVIAFEVFVRPALLKLAGRHTLFRPEVEGTLQDSYRRRPGTEAFLRVRTWRDGGEWRAKLTGRQGAGNVSSVAKANAFAILPSNVASVSEGDRVRLLLLEPLEGW